MEGGKINTVAAEGTSCGAMRRQFECRRGGRPAGAIGVRDASSSRSDSPGTGLAIGMQVVDKCLGKLDPAG